MRKKTASAPPLVVAVIGHGVGAFEFAVACEVFGLDRSAQTGIDAYRFLVAAADPPPIRIPTGGFTIDTPYGLEALEDAHTIVIPARMTSPALIEALRRAHARGARIMSMCTGAFVLAEAGLLDGRRATTHWAHADELQQRYPQIDLDPGVLYVGADNIWTSAGTASGIDLCLHLVRHDYGAEVANYFARRMVVPPHRDGGQAQFVNRPVPTAPSPFDDALVWALNNLDQPVDVAGLARRSAMSPRTFARRFVETTGTTPHKWLIQQRVLHAQELLERTDLSVDVIAAQSGLGTATNLRQHFQRQVRTTPTAYRRAFAS